MISPNRQGMLAKIHIAKKAFALDDGSYRAMLSRLTGKESTKAMSFGQLESVLGEFKRMGWKPQPAVRAGRRKQASDPQAKMIRALWLELRDMGQLRDSSEDALAAFVKKQSGLDDLQWLTPRDADIVINALRGWIKRVTQ